MEYFCHIPCGHSLPEDNPHAVSVSLPQIANVASYEEGDTAFIQSLESGYPRFIMKRIVRQVYNHIRQSENIGADTEFFPLVSIESVALLERGLATEFKKVEKPGANGILLENKSELFQQVKELIQHSGVVMSSRKAEDYLLSVGAVENKFAENLIPGNDPALNIKKILSNAYGSSAPDDVFLCNAGTNAVYSVFSALKAYQAPRGKKVFIRFGWLYIDTIEIIRKYSDEFIAFDSVAGIDALESYLKENGHRVAGLFTEFLTNPLIEAADLERLSSVAKKYGFPLVVDATIATPFNTEIMEYADIAIESLTKYACGSADVLMGAVILNRNSEMAMAVKEKVAAIAVMPYIKEVERLAWEIQSYESRVKQISANTMVMADYFQKCKKVKEVHHALGGVLKDNFIKTRKNPDSMPGLITVVFDKELQYYYDRLPIAKGPSFGTEFTLAMPYAYMAHYSMVKTEEGRRRLLEAGLNPGLLRISIGLEPVEEMIKIFEKI